jgi:CRP-like cAMP-binding protein
MKSSGLRPTLLGRLAPLSSWSQELHTRTYPKGAVIVQVGSEVTDWVAISSGVVSLCSRIADTRVAVATLWHGDVIGWSSPLGKVQARFDVRAMVDVTTVQLGAARLQEAEVPWEVACFAATDERLQEQIFMRLAGNGLQRLVSVLATLATALVASTPRPSAATTLSLPVAQSCLGELSGLSRRQTWIYLGQLAQAGWVRTGRTKVVLDGLSSWLGLSAEIAAQGLGCIATLEQCDATLGRLGLGGAFANFSSRRSPLTDPCGDLER